MKTAILQICCLLFPFIAHAQKSYHAELVALDKLVEDKNQYYEKKEQELKGIKQALSEAESREERFTLSNELFQKYLHFQADSSLHYLNLKAANAPQPLPKEIETELKINRTEVLGVLGMFNESNRIIRTIAPEEVQGKNMRYYYFRTLRAHWGWMADYTSMTDEQAEYTRQMDISRDSMISYATGFPDHYIALADKYVMQGNAQKALTTLEKTKQYDLSQQMNSYLYFTHFQIAELQKNVDQQIYYLAKTAQCDILNGVREYAALQKLAYLMYEVGDIDRAYNYLTCSMEDAVACNTRLRSFQVSAIYPIINQVAQLKEEEQRTFTRNMLIGISVLTLLLIGAIIYLYYWMKKLSQMRMSLSETNEQLNMANHNLAETGKIKELYIARYLERCVNYLNKQEQYRRSLEKLAMAQKVDDLYKAIKSEQFMKEERREFYNEFDKTFLQLFPTFIEKFNRLLTDDAAIHPKSGELLNTELRIFALIRLGITDATQIAHFLGYSLATVYNYRSKIRNKSKGNPEEFENEVMNIS